MYIFTALILLQVTFKQTIFLAMLIIGEEFSLHWTTMLFNVSKLVRITSTSASPQSDTCTNANVLFQSVESDYPLPAPDIP